MTRFTVFYIMFICVSVLTHYFRFNCYYRWFFRINLFTQNVISLSDTVLSIFWVKWHAFIDCITSVFPSISWHIEPLNFCISSVRLWSFRLTYPNNTNSFVLSANMILNFTHTLYWSTEFVIVTRNKHLFLSRLGLQVTNVSKWWLCFAHGVVLS